MFDIKTFLAENKIVMKEDVIDRIGDRMTVLEDDMEGHLSDIKGSQTVAKARAALKKFNSVAERWMTLMEKYEAEERKLS
jgi:hypothetical protein